MPTSTPKIAIILPSREGFSEQHFGAIALCVRDFITHSQYRDNSHVIGAIATTSPFPDISYHRLSAKPYWWQRRSTVYAKACLNWLKHEQPALVEVHNRPNLAAFLCQRWPGKIALHLHNDPQEMKLAKTTEQRGWLLRHCAAIYCVSGYIRDRFLEGITSGSNSQKVHVVYNGLALPHHTSLPPKHQQILFVGRLKPEKGALEFAEALASFLPRHPDWKGVFIGALRHQPDAPLGDYEKHIRATLAPLGAQVEMRGFCTYKETMQATAESAIAVIPSTWHEAFGRTALEAMSCGCIVISSTRGGLKEVIGNAAIPLHEITAETITAALDQVVTHPHRWQEWQQQAFSQAQYFNITATTHTLDTIRADLLS